MPRRRLKQISNNRIPDELLRGLPPFALKKHHHHVGEDKIEFLMRGEGLVELFDLEFAFKEGRFFGHPHRDVAAGFGGGVAGVEEIAGGHAEDGDLAEKAIEEFGSGIFLTDGIVGGIVAGVEDIVVGAENTAPTAAADGAEVLAGGIGEVVAGGPINDLLGFDFSEKGGLGFVGEDFDMFAEFEKLLLGVTNDTSAGVGHGGLAGEGEDFE